MTNTDIFLGSGASLTFVPETHLYIELNHSTSNTTNLIPVADFQNSYLLVQDIYVGCTVEIYNSSATTPNSICTITGNSSNSIQITPAHTATATSGYFCVIRPYGAPCVGQRYSTGSSTARLNADNWLGLLESAEFPNVEVEVKQMNLALGGSRNMTYQYKGIESASGGSLNFMANHGAWLYYALGKCDSLTATMLNSTITNPLAGTSGEIYIDSNDQGAGAKTLETHTEQGGPIFYKTGYAATGVSSTALTPPILKHVDLQSKIEKLDVPVTPSSITKAITYEFKESNNDELPSFSLEQTISKLPSSSPYHTNTNPTLEDTNFVRIARGNRVNSFTMTANENEEVKMTMELNTRAVHKLKQNENYESRGGAGLDNTLLFNYESDEFLEPFFFSRGSFSAFGQQFLKITNLSLTINNNLQEKRFIGVGNTSIQDAIPSNRMYELSFTALVTDDLLFEELFNRNENTGTSVETGGSNFAQDGLIDLQFDKPNGEEINISFKNYFLESANFTIPEDKGPITVEAMVKPRDLKECTVKTHWKLQG